MKMMMIYVWLALLGAVWGQKSHEVFATVDGNKIKDMKVFSGLTSNYS